MSVFAQQRLKRQLQDNQESPNLEAEYQLSEALKFTYTGDYKRALEHYRKSLALDPNNPAAYFKMAELALEAGEHEDANELIEHAIALNPREKYFYLLGSEIKIRMARPAEAAELISQMLANTNATPDFNLRLAELHLESGNEAEALQALAEAEKAYGPLEDILLQKQQVWLQLDKKEEALAIGEELIALYPEDPTYIARQAELLYAHEQPQAAITYLEKFLQEGSATAETHYLLAKLYLQEDQPNKALPHLQHAFSSAELPLEVVLSESALLLEKLPDPQLNDAMASLTQELAKLYPKEAQVLALQGDYFMRMEDKQTARKIYQQALAIDESSFALWQNVMSLGLELGHYDSVAAEAEAALELFPNQPAVYYFGGVAYLNKKSYREAVNLLENGLKLTRKNPELESIFHVHLGDAYHGLDDFNHSDEAYEAALSVNPQNEHALNNYSYYLSLRNQKLERARQLSETLISLFPNNANYLDTHAWVLYRLKEYKEARTILEKALDNGGDQNGTIVEHYGDVLYHLGKPDEALHHWERARMLGNASEQLDQKIKEQKLYE